MWQEFPAPLQALQLKSLHIDLKQCRFKQIGFLHEAAQRFHPYLQLPNLSGALTQSCHRYR